jgi:hypothetical protein
MAGHRTSPEGTGGIVIGVAAMARLFGRSERTLWRWIREHGFPAAMLPSGHMCTSATLIDLWLLGRLKKVHAPTPGTFAPNRQSNDGKAMRIPARANASEQNLGQ